MSVGIRGGMWVTKVGKEGFGRSSRGERLGPAQSGIRLRIRRRRQSVRCCPQ